MSTTSPEEPFRSELELAPEEFAQLVDQVTRRLVRHLEGLESRPVTDGRRNDEVARRLTRTMPEEGRPLETVLDEIFDLALDCGYDTASPGYLAYIPGGGILETAAADLLASAVNRYCGVWVAAPGLASIEAAVGRWLCSLVGFPDGALGTLTTGGSMANLTALVTARLERLGEDFGRGVAYFSDQTHHSMLRAARLAGLASDRVRIVPTGSDFAMRADLLEEAIARDEVDGLHPFFVGLSAGTTNTGAVDPLSDISEIARRKGLWLHVDAAYGGFFLLTERGRRAMSGIGEADSVVLDPHKGLFLPYGNGSLLVRDGEALKRAHSIHADYMPAMQADPSRIDFCEVSPELSRGWRGLRIWLPMMLHGVDAFRRLLDEKLDLAREACARVAAIPGMRVVAPPELSLFAFRLEADRLGEEELDALNRRLLERVNAKGRVFLTGTTLGGRFVPRICVLHFRTHADRMETALGDLEEAAVALGAS